MSEIKNPRYAGARQLLCKKILQSSTIRLFKSYAIEFFYKICHKITSFAFIVAKEVSFYECVESKSAELLLSVFDRLL